MDANVYLPGLHARSPVAFNTLKRLSIAAVTFGAIVLGLGSAPARPIYVGTASWYGAQFSGRPTASGERFDPNAFTAAHPFLPFGSRLRVVHEASGATTIARVNDRMPSHTGRAIDSY